MVICGDQAAFFTIMDQLRTISDHDNDNILLDLRMEREMINGCKIEMILQKFHLIIQIQLRTGDGHFSGPLAHYIDAIFFFQRRINNVSIQLHDCWDP